MAIGGVVLVVYGPSVAFGFFSDDFLYREWARQGFGSLLAHLTFDSYPRVLRPLPAWSWWLAGDRGGAAELHALSLLLHAGCATLVARLVDSLTGSAARGLACGLLFAVFPLHPEAVVWPSASFDLWACLLGMVALWICVACDEGWPAALAAGGSYGAALLSKESVFLLPLVALILIGKRARRAAAAMLCVAAVYLSIRWAALGGPGGYLDGSGRSLAAGFSPLAFLRALLVQLPHRILVPVKAPGVGYSPILSLSVGLLAVLAWCARPDRRPTELARAGLAFVVALLPAAPLFRVGSTHEGSRLLYFPVAILTIGLGRAVSSTRRAVTVASCSLVLLWGAATTVNLGSWRSADRRVHAVLRAMEAAQPRYPAGAEILVEAPDSVAGAYVFRNGLPEAASLSGLRTDLAWRRGTTATLGSRAVERLGSSLFVLEPSATGAAIDRTACERALYRETVRALRTWGPEELARDGPPPYTLVSPPIPVPETGVQVRIRTRDCPLAEPAAAELYWRDPEGAPFSAARGRRLVLEPGAGLVAVRVPDRPPGRALQVRVDLDRADALPCIEQVSAAPLPPACAAAHPAGR